MINMTAKALNSTRVISAGYSLEVIGEEQVPLAGAPQTGYYLATISVMVLVAVALLLAIYLVRCWSYRRRIRELDPKGNAFCGWSVRRLKETIKELESMRITENFEDT